MRVGTVRDMDVWSHPTTGVHNHCVMLQQPQKRGERGRGERKRRRETGGREEETDVETQMNEVMYFLSRTEFSMPL